MSYNSILASAPLTTQNYHLKMIGTTIGNSLIWDNGTNVGIGNTNTSYTLDVSGTGRFSSNVNIDGEYLTIGGATNNAVINNIASFRFNLDCDNTGTGESFTVGHNQTIINDSNVLFRIQDNGNVGIGTSSPSKLFTVVSSTDGQNAGISGASYGLRFDNGGAFAFGGSTIHGVDNTLTATYQILGLNGSQVIFGTGGTERMRITSGGEIYMGSSTTDKNSRLVVYGSTSDGNTYAFRCYSSGSDILFGVRTDGYINTGNYTSSPYNLVRTGRVMMVDSAGGVGYQSSTRESKTNITNLEDISFIYKLNPVSFNYRKSEGTSNVFTDEYNEDLQYGLIADEVEKVNKELVFYNEKDGVKELAGVEYGKLTAVLIKAIQEQQAQIQSLQEQINILAK